MQQQGGAAVAQAVAGDAGNDTVAHPCVREPMGDAHAEERQDPARKGHVGRRDGGGREQAGEDGKFVAAITDFYANFYTSTGQTSDGLPVHDSSAVAYALHPEFFTVERGPVRVISGGIAHGQTILRPEKKFDHAADWNGRPSVNVCVGVDSAAFL
eukprot:gene60656-80887_t